MSCSGGWLPSGGAAREEGIGEEVPLSGILGRSSCFSTQFPKVSGFFPVKKTSTAVALLLIDPTQAEAGSAAWLFRRIERFWNRRNPTVSPKDPPHSRRQIFLPRLVCCLLHRLGH